MTTIVDFNFNDQSDLNDWTIISGNPDFVNVVNGILVVGQNETAVGNRILMAHNTLIPFDPSKLYETSTRLWRGVYTSYSPPRPAGSISIGFIGYATDGETIVSIQLDGNILLLHAHTGYEVNFSFEPGTDLTIPFTLVGRTQGHSTINDGRGDPGDTITQEQFQYLLDNGINPKLTASVGIAYIRPVIHANYYQSSSTIERYNSWSIDWFRIGYFDYDVVIDSPTSVYTINADAYSVIRGSSITIDVTVSDATDGVLFYEVFAVNETCEPYDFYGPNGYVFPSGEVNILSGSGQIVIPTSADVIYGTTGTTTDIFKVAIRKESIIGPIVIESANISLQPIGTQFDLVRSKAEVSEIYQAPEPIYVDGVIVGFIDGPSTITIRVYCNQKPAGTVVPFELTGIQAADLQEMRINNVVVPVSLTGSFTLLTYNATSNYSDLKLTMANDGLLEPTERCTLTLQDPGGTLNMVTPHPSIYFDIVGYEISDDYGLQTFSSDYRLVFSADVMSFLTVQRGTVTVSNTLSSGNTTQDVYVAGLVADENWIVSLHLPAFDVSYKIWADVYTGFFRINFTRNTALGTPPSSVVMSYSVLRV